MAPNAKFRRLKHAPPLSSSQNMKDAAITVQSVVRMGMHRSRFVSMKASSVVLQCLARCSQAKARSAGLLKYRAATRLSAKWRGARQRRDFRTCVEAAVKIQARARCRTQKARFVVRLAEAKEEAKMEVRRYYEGKKGRGGAGRRATINQLSFSNN